MAPTVSARDRRRLAIEAHAQAAKTAELAHSCLRTTEAVKTHAHRRDSSAVHTTVDVAARRKTGRLEGKHLVRSKLLLVESLLLLLQRLDLVLDGDLLPGRVGIHTRIGTDPSTHLLRHDSRDVSTFVGLPVAIVEAAEVAGLILLRELEPDVFLVDRRTHREVRTRAPACSKHEARRKLRAAGRTKNLSLLLLLRGKRLKARRVEALRQ